MERDITESLSAVHLIAPATLSADNTPASVDLLGYQAAAIYVGVGVGGITFSSTNRVDFVLTHSDDNSTFTPVAQADVIGVTVGAGGIVRSLIAAHANPSVTEVGYVGRKRWLRMLADFSGTHGAGTPISVLCVRGLPLTAPVA